MEIGEKSLRSPPPPFKKQSNFVLGMEYRKMQFLWFQAIKNTLLRE